MNMKKSVWIFCAAIVLGLCASAAQAQAVNASDQKALLLVGESVPTQPPQGMQASASLSNDILGQWNRAGSLLLGMAKDFPEDKMDYRPTPAVRTFAEQILHATVASKVFSDMAGGVMPKSFDEVEHPSRETYKTRQQLVDLIQKTFADGAKVTRAWMFTFATAHMYDHYGQCVVYYRINGLVPPDSRQQ
jgi:hypothetical protein